MFLNTASPNQSIKINDVYFNLNELEALAWKKLVNGAVKKKNGFRTMCVATISQDNCASVRTVVNRKVDELQKIIYFHTDNRSRKFQELGINNSISLLFYDSRQRVQIVVKATAIFHTNDVIAADRWQATSPKAMLSYMTIDPPNTPSNEATLGYAQKFQNSVPAKEESLPFQQNFSVVACHVHQLEFLYLNFDGNYKANFYYKTGGVLEQSEWAVP